MQIKTHFHFNYIIYSESFNVKKRVNCKVVFAIINVKLCRILGVRITQVYENEDISAIRLSHERTGLCIQCSFFGDATKRCACAVQPCIQKRSSSKWRSQSFFSSSALVQHFAHLHLRLVSYWSMKIPFKFHLLDFPSLYLAHSLWFFTHLTKWRKQIIDFFCIWFMIIVLLQKYDIKRQFLLIFKLFQLTRFYWNFNCFIWRGEKKTNREAWKRNERKFYEDL